MESIKMDLITAIKGTLFAGFFASLIVLFGLWLVFVGYTSIDKVWLLCKIFIPPVLLCFFLLIFVGCRMDLV